MGRVLFLLMTGLRGLEDVQASMIAGVERFLKQAIVDKNPAVASAALVSALHLFNDNKEVVKRWVNEVQEACNNKGRVPK